MYPAVRASAKATRPVWLFALLGAFALADEPAPRPAATNGKIAFTSDRDGDLEIYLMNEDGTEQKRLTNNPGFDYHPAFSPSGTKIAFIGQTPAGTFALKTMNADGSNSTEITAINFQPSPYPWHETVSLSWSPDGGKIAFAEAGDVFTINLDGTERRNLTNHPANDFEPSWSPDGKRILFISSRANWRTMLVMNADGSEVRELPGAGDYFWDTSPDYSPTGGKIVFVVRSEDYLPVLYTANADGTERTVFDGCDAGLCSTHRNNPRWSPDGKKIVFHMWEYFSNDAQIYVKGFDGSAVQLTRGGGRNFQPAWQPVAAPASVPVPAPAPGPHLEGSN